MSQTELVATRKHYRTQVPRDHRQSLDTRIKWLWNQRFGTVQTVWKESSDLLDHTAATLLLQCVLGKGDLNSIALAFQRLEGGSLADEEVLEKQKVLRI